jgi:hypothetical protein
MLNNGTLMKSPRLSKTTTGRAIPWTSNLMVDQPTSDAPLPTQDGGRCGNTKTHSLLMRKERSFTCKEMLTLKTETLKPDQETERSTSNGTLSTLMSGRESQEREK